MSTCSGMFLSRGAGLFRCGLRNQDRRSCDRTANAGDCGCRQTREWTVFSHKVAVVPVLAERKRGCHGFLKCKEILDMTGGRSSCHGTSGSLAQDRRSRDNTFADTSDLGSSQSGEWRVCSFEGDPSPVTAESQRRPEVCFQDCEFRGTVGTFWEKSDAVYTIRRTRTYSSKLQIFRQGHILQERPGWPEAGL